MERKSRYAYGYSKKDGKLLVKQDVWQEALKANMMMRDYENNLIKLNPQLTWEIRIEN